MSVLSGLLRRYTRHTWFFGKQDASRVRRGKARRRVVLGLRRGGATQSRRARGVRGACDAPKNPSVPGIHSTDPSFAPSDAVASPPACNQPRNRLMEAHAAARRSGSSTGLPRSVAKREDQPGTKGSLPNPVYPPADPGRSPYAVIQGCTRQRAASTGAVPPPLRADAWGYPELCLT
jgi:hypothetical protein